MKRILMIMALLGPAISYAEVVQCSVKLKAITVESKRDDAFIFQNRMVVSFVGAAGDTKCGGKEYATLENTDGAYAGILSTALAAKAMTKGVLLGINTLSSTSGDPSNRIAYISVDE